MLQNTYNLNGIFSHNFLFIVPIFIGNSQRLKIWSLQYFRKNLYENSHCRIFKKHNVPKKIKFLFIRIFGVFKISF